VLWREVESLAKAEPDDEVYVLDAGSGEIRFGDGVHGRIPDKGSVIGLSVAYGLGGGRLGGVAQNFYKLKVPAGGAVTLTTRIEAWEEPSGRRSKGCLAGVAALLLGLGLARRARSGTRS
jgi:hypothetical protein